MSEDEINLYSEFQKEFNSKATKARNREFYKKMSDGDLKKAKFWEMSNSVAKELNRDSIIPVPSNNVNDIKVHYGRVNNKFSHNDPLADCGKVPGDTIRNRNVMRELRQEKEKAKKLKNIKTGSKIALGTAAGLGLVYGGKKVYDHYKEKEKND